ncbi:quinoprotein relay system zinc metallohydrolase 2 [Salinisphaera orenii]|uniref:Metallo-beta-lactamase domain-containing protein n=1 Tax=Salinisphaera orenii YIM 95161 TaxID=1051139 RepID=A0A423PMM2_9GAMM|nr:quinoprotein relay system zinc metallohydrolase 2 [Salinisphaera halophila]ROO26751.1 hypothetical protein SAHL_12610 [Salinisphaera halophila YIM 95161]
MRVWRLAVVVLSGAVVALSAAFADDSAKAALAVSERASGVYVHEGAQADADRHNRGDIANIGFVVGTRCVAVIDTGGTPTIGRRLKAAVERETNRPVCYVINTHMHPDHVLGNRAFADGDTRFIAAEGYWRALSARASSYLDSAANHIGVDADESWIVEPDRMIADQATIRLGDRTLTLTAHQRAHTDNDLTVFDSKTGTLWLGDLLFVDRVPSIDGSLTGWLDVIAALEDRENVDTIIPGHGPLGHDLKRMLGPEKRYLSHLRRDVRKAIDDGYGIDYAVANAAREERDDWRLFDQYHPRNVTAAYTELEWQ